MTVRAIGVGCRVIGLVVIAAFLVAAFTSAPTAIARRLATPPDIGHADAIVVLGASIDADGTLSDASLRRALGGIRLYRQGLAPRVVFLGMYGEAMTRARLASELGVPREAILTEGEEPTTRHEAARMAQILRPLGARSVLLVTDTLHMRRARRLFERAGLEVRPAPTATGVVTAHRPERRVILTRMILQELVALAYHELFGYL